MEIIGERAAKLEKLEGGERPVSLTGHVPANPAVEPKVVLVLVAFTHVVAHILGAVHVAPLHLAWELNLRDNHGPRPRWGAREKNVTTRKQGRPGATLSDTGCKPCWREEKTSTSGWWRRSAEADTPN